MLIMTFAHAFKISIQISPIENVRVNKTPNIAIPLKINVLGIKTTFNKTSSSK